MSMNHSEEASLSGTGTVRQPGLSQAAGLHPTLRVPARPEPEGP